MQIGKVRRPFHPGDRILIYTDGLTELSLPDRSQFGSRRLKKVFQTLSKSDPKLAVADLVKNIQDAKKETPLEDDITFVLVDRAA